MTPMGDFREIAFWLDAALLSLASYDSVKREDAAPAFHTAVKTLVSVSCEYNPAWHDARAAETFAQIDARTLGPKPEALRHAFRTAPKSTFWDSGDYVKLLADTGDGSQN